MSHASFTQPADAVTLLTQDHRTVTALWQQAQEQTSEQAKVLDEIVRQLSIHDGIEKQLLYPTVRDRVEGGAEMADRSLTEHQQVEDLLEAVERVGVDSPEALRIMRETMDNVQEHVAEEEAVIFPALRAALSEEDLIELGTKLDAAKKTAPTHPHPASPNDGVAAKVAGLAGGLVDTAKDAIAGRPSDE